MGMHIIIDLILIILAAAIILRCRRQGFVSSLIRLGGTIASYLAATFLSAPISLQIYDNFISSRLLTYASSLLPPELESFPPTLIDAATHFPEVKAQLTDTVNAAFAGAGFDAGFPARLVETEHIGNRLVDSILEGGSTVAEALVEVIMKPAALTLTRMLVFIIIFALLSAVVSLLFRMGKAINHIPLLGGLNRLAGMGVGVLEAAISLYVAAALIFIAATLLGSSDIAFLHGDVLAQSSMLNWIMSWRLPEGFVIFPN